MNENTRANAQMSSNSPEINLLIENSMTNILSDASSNSRILSYLHHLDQQQQQLFAKNPNSSSFLLRSQSIENEAATTLNNSTNDIESIISKSAEPMRLLEECTRSAGGVSLHTSSLGGGSGGVNGSRGIWVNKREAPKVSNNSIQWSTLNFDEKPEVLFKKSQQSLEYTQESIFK